MATYVEEVRQRLQKELPDVAGALLDLYTLLVLVTGRATVLEDVHDAWAVWRSRTDPTHRSIIPFEELADSVQEMDRKYADAIARVARDIGR